MDDGIFGEKPSKETLLEKDLNVVYRCNTLLRALHHELQLEWSRARHSKAKSSARWEALVAIRQRALAHLRAFDWEFEVEFGGFR